MAHTAGLARIADDSDGAQIRDWFAADAEGIQRLEFYAQPEKWFSMFGPKRMGWFVVIDEQPVGFVDIELNDGSGYIAYYVAPEHRGKGYGTQALRSTIDQARELQLSSLAGSVESDNSASIAALKRAGFEFAELDEDDMFPVHLDIA